MIRVTIWNEYIHEQEIPAIGAVYPKGIHGAIKEFLSREQDITVKTATLQEPECGLTEGVLRDTDVLIWWGHTKHEAVPDEVCQRVCRHVLAGMGLIALHSAHLAKPLRKLLGTTMSLQWKDDDEELLYCTAPAHPIAAGVAYPVHLPQEELYGEYFDIPKPEEVVFTGWFRGGAVFRSGVIFTRGYGKIFYFQPGHEAYPIYHHRDIQRIITNAVRYCAPVQRMEEPCRCENIPGRE